MVTTFYPPYNFGGDGTYVKALSAALVRRGHEVTVVHCEDAFRTKSNKAVTSVDESDGVNIVRIKLRSGILSSLFTQQFGRPGFKNAQLKELFSHEYDVVNFHNISLIGGPGILFMSNAPVKVYTLHEHWLLCPTHVFWKNNIMACDTRHCFSCCIRSKIPPQLWRYSSLIEDATREIDCFISPSLFTADRHQELLSNDMNIEVIPHFSPISAQLEHREELDRDGYLFVGRVTKSKGIIELLATFAKCPYRTINIVGDGDLLEALKEKYASNTNIVFHGKIEQYELRHFYRSSLAVVLSSLAPETFGLTVVEGFAFGTPALVRRAGGNVEAVEASSAGCIYTTEGELLTAMDRMESDTAHWKFMSNNALKAYENDYNECVHVDRYLNLVGSILENKKNNVEKLP